MIVLGIHTASAACELALLRNGACLGVRHEAMVRGQDARLPLMTKNLLTEHEIRFEDIDRYAVITGPGSFTGIRVGVAFARGLALSSDGVAIGVTSLEAALPAGQQGSAIVALSAQKRPPDITFWTQNFRSGERTGDAVERPLNDLQALLNSHPHMVYGDPAALSPHLPGHTIHTAAPSAIRAAEVGADFDPDLHPPRPTYARAPDATLPQNKANI